jgi:hypothetical protein
MRAQLDGANRAAASMNEAAGKFDAMDKEREAREADAEFEREQREKLVDNNSKSY